MFTEMFGHRPQFHLTSQHRNDIAELVARCKVQLDPLYRKSLETRGYVQRQDSLRKWDEGWQRLWHTCCALVEDAVNAE